MVPANARTDNPSLMDTAKLFKHKLVKLVKSWSMVPANARTDNPSLMDTAKLLKLAQMDKS